MSRLKKIIFWPFKKRKRLVVIAIILLIAVFAWYMLIKQKTPAPQYQTAQVEVGTLVKTVTASGLISSGNSVDITSQVSGVVTQVYVKNGDTVVQGQKIADIQLDQTSLVRQASAWASYVSSSNGLKNAENNLRGVEASLEKTLDDIHQSQYGNGGFAGIAQAGETLTQKQQRTAAEVAKDNAFNGVNTARAQIAASWLSYQQLSSAVMAPIGGTVTNSILTSGYALIGNSSTTSTTSSQKLGTVILNQGQIQAAVNLSEIDVTLIKVGQKATLTLDAFPGKTFTGKVLTIDTNGAVSQGVTTYPATIGLDSAVDNIYPNMAVSATIIINVKDKVLMVPSAAVVTNNGQSTIRVLRDGQLQSVDVETGESNDSQTEIVSGISEGDTVVTSVVTNQTGSSTQGGSVFGGGGFGAGRGGGFGGGGAGGNVRIQTR